MQTMQLRKVINQYVRPVITLNSHHHDLIDINRTDTLINQDVIRCRWLTTSHDQLTFIGV